MPRSSAVTRSGSGLAPGFSGAQNTPTTVVPRAMNASSTLLPKACCRMMARRMGSLVCGGERATLPVKRLGLQIPGTRTVRPAAPQIETDDAAGRRRLAAHPLTLAVTGPARTAPPRGCAPRSHRFGLAVLDNFRPEDRGEQKRRHRFGLRIARSVQ